MKMKKALALLLAAVLLVACSVMGTLAYLTSTTEVAQNTFTVGDVIIWLDEEDVDDSQTGENEDTEESELLNTGRDLGNAYTGDFKLVPGRELPKDPTVWVKADSENAYIRMVVTVGGYDKLIDALDYKFVEGSDTDKYYIDTYNNQNMVVLDKVVDCNYGTWKFETFSVQENTATYEFRFYPNDGIWTKNYGTLVDTKIEAMGETDSAADDYYRLPALFTTITVPSDINNADLALLGEVTIDVIAHAIQAEGFDNAAAAWGAWSD